MDDGENVEYESNSFINKREITTNIISLTSKVNDNQITFNWNKLNIDDFSYNIYGNETLLKRIMDINQLTFTVNDLIYSKRYVFQVKIQKIDNSFIESNKIIITPSEPIDIIKTLNLDIQEHDKKLTLNIRNNTILNSFIYDIYIKNNNDWELILNKSVNIDKTNEFIIIIISNLENWKNYEFKIIGKNTNNITTLEYEFNTIKNVLLINDTYLYDISKKLIFPVNYNIIFNFETSNIIQIQI